MDAIPFTCDGCNRLATIGAGQASVYVYTDATGPRAFHDACKPAVISGLCYVCRAPASQEKHFVVDFVKLGLIAERAVCDSAHCWATLARETQTPGVDAHQVCHGCWKTYSALATQCPNCGRQ